MDERTMRRVLVLGIIAVAGCGTPSPERLCARVAEVSGKAVGSCVEDLAAEQKNDAAAFKQRAACVSAANDRAAMDRCFDDRARAQYAAQAQGDARIAECIDAKIKAGLAAGAARAACEAKRDGGPPCACQPNDPLCSCL